MVHHAPVSERIHDHELNTSERVVRAVLSAERPEWSQWPMTYVRSSGTSNALWRLHTDSGTDLLVRLPRRPHGEESVLRELRLLPEIARSPLTALIQTPRVSHVGQPSDAFPHAWTVLEWIDGEDLWTARHEVAARLDELAIDLARVVRAIRGLEGLPAPERRPGERGGPLAPLLDRIEAWLEDPRWHAAELLDVGAVRCRAAESSTASEAPVTIGFVHGDLIPGNLLVRSQRLHAILDWGSAGYGDIAQDLTPAWAVLDVHSRSTFRDYLGVDDPTWLRARAFALEQAVGGVLYYVPRRHPLGDVMARTLDSILTEQ